MTFKTKLKKNSISAYERKVITQFEINAADTLNFRTLKGIGEVLSSRIVKYRKLLGGFYSTHQLTEVYGVEPETVNTNIEYILEQNGHRNYG